MALKDQLPYLGKIQKDEALHIGEHIKIDYDCLKLRPDYKKFKSKSEEYQSEDTCIAVLTGLSCFEECESEMFEIERMAIKEAATKDNISSLSPIVHEWMEFTSIKKSLEDLIKHGKARKKFGKHYSVDNEDDVFLYSSMVFKPYSYLNGLKFLAWAEKKLYKIPKELAFIKDENGNLSWVSSSTDQLSIATDKQKKIEKWAKIATTYCQDKKKERGQNPQKTEVETYLKKQLIKSDEKLGKNKTLSDYAFRDVWHNVPENCKRKQGEKNKS